MSATRESSSSAGVPVASSGPPQQPREPQRGIDIQQALSILSARSEPSENRDYGCGCCHGNEVPENATSMGQTIDLLAASSTSAQPPHTELSDEERAREQKRLEDERKQRQEKIQAELRSMSDMELRQAVLEAQQDRVATYREYEKGLQIVLQTGNMTTYPDACAKATASFSVLSETIKSIQELLESQRQRKDLSKFITQLQRYEKEKLYLTAACHLERIRERNQKVESEQDPRTAKLLRDGVQSLQQKIQAVVEQINEVLDEIRCVVLEEG